jgi:Flp pilus assembly protein TadD
MFPRYCRTKSMIRQPGAYFAALCEWDMKINRHIKPTLLGVSALLLSACASGGYSTVSTAMSIPGQEVSGPSELMLIANQLAANGDHTAAIPLYRHLGARNGNPVALRGLASSLIAQGAHNEAVRILNLLVERGQATADVWYGLGKTQLATGHFTEALVAFTNAENLDGETAKIRSGKAISLAALGRTGEAIAAFNMGTDRLTLSNKALVLAATGKAAAAIRVLEPVMRGGSGTSRDRQNLAMAYLLAGQEEEAYRLARLDLDKATIDETFTFYRSLTSLEPAHRMQALVTGTVNPNWTRAELANLNLQETTERTTAAKRLVQHNILARTTQPTQIAKAAEKPNPVKQADFNLTDIPPLLEPEGWALQIGAYRTIKNLMRGLKILYSESGDILADVPPRRSEVDFGDKDDSPSGFYYRLNAGPLKTLARANELCRILKQRGTKCWIRPPEKSEGKLPDTKTAEGAAQGSTLTTEMLP